VEKDVIVSFWDVHLYSGAIKVRSTRSTRYCVCTQRYSYWIRPSIHPPSLSFQFTKNLRDLDVIQYFHQCILHREEKGTLDPSDSENSSLTEKKMNKHINLLYVQNNNVLGHFALIKNLSRLVSSQISKHEYEKRLLWPVRIRLIKIIKCFITLREKKIIIIFLFRRCLYYFSSSKKLEAHAMDCGQMNDCAIRLPSEDDYWLSFKNHCKKERILYMPIYNIPWRRRKWRKRPATNTSTIGYLV